LTRAIQLASQRGLDGLSIGDLASDLGLSKSGLFSHFGSKEDLQVEVLRAASVRFDETVLKPALKAERGRPRLVAFFDCWLRWIADPSWPGGCLFMAAATELDDREGKARDHLASGQRQLLATIGKSARLAIEEGDFRPDLDCEAFAFELLSIALGYNHNKRLLRDRKAEARARAAFERLLEYAAAE
ncbi:MAG TPA: TetR/AcrR family transcriptional regulator, partial [Polyangiales bacterium]|nr:TetR/AcrR family transcriptional regulator [Polyangiales bacterium]